MAASSVFLILLSALFHALWNFFSKANDFLFGTQQEGTPGQAVKSPLYANRFDELLGEVAAS